ncbi:SoxR reducing system RseC family protein [Stutzerimonas zhaodongensis]|uniref:SoxR reducing system RseC family protein n=1 Tax=Stutzerimonas TaxID=2901164 RepID=UPI00388DEC86
MIEEVGRVVALAPGAVWVETKRSSTCSSCSVKNGCGQGVMDRLGIRERRNLTLALCDLRLSVGDGVVIGVQERTLLRGAALVYLFPLIALLLSAAVASALSAVEANVMLAGICGFAISWLVVYKRSQYTASDPELQPVVLRATMTVTAADQAVCL